MRLFHFSSLCRSAGSFLACAAALTTISLPSLRAAVDDLRITEVRPDTDQVEVTNTATTGFTTAANLPFSHALNESSVIPSGTAFASGEAKVFTVTGLSDTASDIWLYRDTNFTSSASILAGMKYGSSAAIGRETVAVAAGIWPSATDFVAAPASGESLQANALDVTDPAIWISAAPKFGTFFGDGTNILDPLPPIPKGTIAVELETIASGLISPIRVVEPPDGSKRLFIQDQSGLIQIVDSGGTLLPTPFLDVSGQLIPLGIAGPGTYDERGFLGFAFHPDFATNRKFYTYMSVPVAAAADFTNPATVQDSQSIVVEWQADSLDPNVADTSASREILRVDEPQFNHNAGTMHFGPDGMLYIAFGDGGAGDDSNVPTAVPPVEGHDDPGNGQNTDTILGSIIRIDVDGNNSANGQYGIPADNPFVGGPGLDEIWAHGFRNPYLFSFDRLTGALYVGDVGQNDIEEVDVVSAGDNCGWRLKEGSFFFDPNGPNPGFVTTIPVEPIPPGLVDPIAEYDHDNGTTVDNGIAISGGFVYRGSAIPALQGLYVTGDFSKGFGSPAGRLWYLTASNEFRELIIGADDRPLGLYLKGFGEDLDGELYICGSQDLGPSGASGVVLKLVPVPTTAVSSAFAYR